MRRLAILSPVTFKYYLTKAHFVKLEEAIASFNLSHGLVCNDQKQIMQQQGLLL